MGGGAESTHPNNQVTTSGGLKSGSSPLPASMLKVWAVVSDPLSPCGAGGRQPQLVSNLRTSDSEAVAIRVNTLTLVAMHSVSVIIPEILYGQGSGA